MLADTLDWLEVAAGTSNWSEVLAVQHLMDQQIVHFVHQVLMTNKIAMMENLKNQVLHLWYM